MMKTAADFAAEFIRRAKAGGHPKVRVRKEYAEVFLGELVREGLKFADHCLNEIRDPDLRDIIRTVLLSGAAGAVLGAAAGAIGGPKGAAVGAVIGAGVGVAAAMFAIVVTYRQEDGAIGPELVVEVASA